MDYRDFRIWNIVLYYYNKALSGLRYAVSTSKILEMFFSYSMQGIFAIFWIKFSLNINVICFCDYSTFYQRRHKKSDEEGKLRHCFVMSGFGGTSLALDSCEEWAWQSYVIARSVSEITKL